MRYGCFCVSRLIWLVVHLQIQLAWGIFLFFFFFLLVLFFVNGVVELCSSFESVVLYNFILFLLQECMYYFLRFFLFLIRAWLVRCTHCIQRQIQFDNYSLRQSDKLDEYESFVFFFSSSDYSQRQTKYPRCSLANCYCICSRVIRSARP